MAIREFTYKYESAWSDADELFLHLNTGNQRSSQTPPGASTSTTPIGLASRGKRRAAKNMPVFMAMHPTSYVATATLSHFSRW